MPHTVNPPNVDAATQPSISLIADSPALAMGAIYQAAAQSAAVLLQNAVAQQQQQNALMQAVASQGVMIIYSLATAASETAVEKLLQTNSAETVATPLAAASTTAAAINSQITDALKLTLDSVLPHSGDVAYGLRAVADALAASIEHINRANRENMLHVVQLAARTAYLAAIAREPDKAAAYQDAITALDKLV
ncbi:MAG: RebB family R body protein [Rhodanobacteraceae bacterium]|nr:RebB family R body protein [Rhodanobacteraceae bacterium]